MTVLLRGKILVLLLAATLGGLVSARPAQAARYVKFRVYLDGQFILVAGAYDNGHSTKDTLWNNLKKLPVVTPRTQDFAELMPAAQRGRFLSDDTARRAAGRPPQHAPYVIKADADHPLQATLEGKIRVESGYSYTREVSTLRFVRKTPADNRWQIAPEEVDRMRGLQGKGGR